jgi:PAS domain-containing protein
MVAMNTADLLHHRASELVRAARAFHACAEEPGSHAAAPDSLATLEEALQVLSAAWYQLAADASPVIVEQRRGQGSEAPSWRRFDGVSREQEVCLMGTLHDVAAAFARCARACRDGRSTVTPIIARRVAGDGRRRGDQFPRFRRHQRPTGHFA